MKKKDGGNSLQIQLGGKVVSYSVRRSARAKNISIKVSPDRGLEVVMPSGVKFYNVESCLKSREDWIIARLDQIKQLQDKKDSGQVVFLGRKYGLVPIIRHQASASVKILDDKIYITVPDNSPKTLADALERWYRAQARIIIEDRLWRINKEAGYKINRIFIKGQKTRWGSCSRLGNLNFNWRLAMAPVEIIDYIVIHELSHLEEMNHSANFWRLVEKLCPDYKKYRKWLRENGPLLTL
ncbi:MAG: hypothetical protein JL50_19625 [Peptococcaceae bacterium BICA1-7]|nr:MAG: hypothetical protein JL50_19625 [Peptococcaceae bacterium BICA1-7]HBV98287.1 M48 family peptidase [Desulfotomaculum sp.]